MILLDINNFFDAKHFLLKFKIKHFFFFPFKSKANTKLEINKTFLQQFNFLFAKALKQQLVVHHFLA